MSVDKSDSSDTNVTNIADARRERLDKSSIPYGRRQSDDSAGPNLSARLEDLQNKPNVRPVMESRTSGRRFDREKVEKIKAQLARGEYQIDSLRVADMFIEHERHN
ncbi:MAG: flagellar biosynthesis anti-sigma factor FlgM [Granulosicoccus sp.]